MTNDARDLAKPWPYDVTWADWRQNYKPAFPFWICFTLIPLLLSTWWDPIPVSLWNRDLTGGRWTDLLSPDISVLNLIHLWKLILCFLWNRDVRSNLFHFEFDTPVKTFPSSWFCFSFWCCDFATCAVRSYYVAVFWGTVMVDGWAG